MTKEQLKIIQQLSQMGDVILVRQDGSRLILNDEGKVPLKTQLDAVLYFMQRLDEGMLKLILEDSYTYQDFDKKTFLKKLSDVFDEFKEKGNTFLNLYEGKCNSCLLNKKNRMGFTFIGNKTNHYTDFVFEVKDGKVHDIHECFDFSTENSCLLKKGRLSIDDNVPF
jgi:hypothetical protein